MPVKPQVGHRPQLGQTWSSGRVPSVVEGFKGVVSIVRSSVYMIAGWGAKVKGKGENFGVQGRFY